MYNLLKLVSVTSNSPSSKPEVEVHLQMLLQADLR